MKILIVGAGAVGQTLARQLSTERHLVTVVEQDPDLVAWLGERVDALVIAGNGGTADVLEKAGVRDADLLVAVTDRDEVNMLACMVGLHYEVKTKIARIRNLDYLRDLQKVHRDRLPIEMAVNPEQATAQEIARVLRIPVARYVSEFAEGQLKLIGMRAPAGAPIVSLPLDELRAMYSTHAFIVCAIARGDTVIVPRGDAEIRPGDDVFVMVHNDALNLVNVLGGKDQDSRLAKVLILGGSRIGTSLAADLEDTGVEVVLIDHDQERCEQLTSRLKRVTVVYGDGTDIELLAEVGVETADGFVAATGDDETNILASVQVKRLGCGKVAAVTRKAQYATLIASTGLIDTAVNPNTVTADAIARHVHEGQVLSLSSLGVFKADVVEYVAAEGSSVVGYALKDLKLPHGCVIAAIMSRGKVRTPTGDDVISEGDRVIVSAEDTVVEQVDRLFGRKRWLV